MNTEARQCQNCKNSFNIEPDDFSFYEKMKVPAPHVCPDCRFKMRALFRNEMSLYTGRTCDMCSKSIITMYNPKSPYKIYCLNCHKGDGWDPKEYSQDYDFNRPFFDQLGELLKNVPKASLFDASGYGPNIRSDFVNTSANLKDCYLVFNTGPAENTYYSRGIDASNEVCDGYFSTKDEQCYEIINVHECSKVVFSNNLRSCVDCYFCEDLSGCTNCFGCVGLRNKSLYIYNEPVSREEYDMFIKSFQGSYNRYQEEKNKFESYRLQFPKKENHNINSVNSIGDYLNETKNVAYSFEIRGGGEDSKYCFSCKGIKDSFGIIGYGVKSEMLLECASTGNSSNIIGSHAIDQSRDIQYSFSCKPNNNNLFGCDGLKNSEYCVLNKQYSKEEYEIVKNHIIEELTKNKSYGLMMPPYIAPFAYNETLAQDNMPMTKEEALASGFRWEDNIQMTVDKETLKPEQIPDHIEDVADTLLEEILSCIDCKRNYKIIEPELLFYRKMILPIPRKCFYCRHRNRIIRRGPYKFWDRKCVRCNKDIKTNYSPEQLEIIYCEKCYQQEVY